MTVVTFKTPAFARRDADMICWRVSAIYRCCLRLGMPKSWALEKLREISPDGKRDHMTGVWFSNIESVRSYYFSRIQTADPVQEFAEAA